MKVDDIATLKGGSNKQSNLSQRMTFKPPTPGIKDKTFDFGKQRHSTEFVKNFEAISKYIGVNYKHRGPKMAMAINNMDMLIITIPETP